MSYRTDWLRELLASAGKGTIDNIDARALANALQDACDEAIAASKLEGLGLQLDTPVGNIQLIGDPLVVEFVQKLIHDSYKA